MRYATEAPSGVMDLLFVGAPALGAGAGLPRGAISAWRRSRASRRTGSPRSGVASARCCSGTREQFYNFQGLRSFKDKFDPVWEPRYLASPGGLALAGVLTDVAALISGGVTGVIVK